MQQNFKDFQPGPFRAEQIHDGDYYELSNGNAIQCMPGGRDHADGNSTGAAIVITDPNVEWSGVDAGYSPEPGTLRAPDVAVGTPGDETGWIKGAPLLAIEYAGIGQDEDDLQEKIADLLRAGTKLVWVVRLTGTRRVEIYAAGQRKRIARVTDVLTAPGILLNSIPVKAFYDRTIAKEVMLRNLLHGQGYASLDDVRLEAEAKGKAEGEAKGKAEGEAEGKVQGKADAILAVLASRGLNVSAPERLQILGCIADEILQGWLMRVSHISTTAELFE